MLATRRGRLGLLGFRAAVAMSFEGMGTPPFVEGGLLGEIGCVVDLGMFAYFELAEKLVRRVRTEWTFACQKSSAKRSWLSACRGDIASLCRVTSWLRAPSSVSMSC